MKALPEAVSSEALHSIRLEKPENEHYENLPMQYTEIFSTSKIANFIRKMLIFFLFLLKT